MKGVKRRKVLTASLAGAAVAALPRMASAAQEPRRITGIATTLSKGELIVHRGPRPMSFLTAGVFWDSDAGTPDDFLGTEVVVEFTEPHRIAQRVSHLYRITRGAVEARTAQSLIVAGIPFALSRLSRVGRDGSVAWISFDDLLVGQRVAVRHRRRAADGADLAMQVTVLAQ